MLKLGGFLLRLGKHRERGVFTEKKVKKNLLEKNIEDRREITNKAYSLHCLQNS
jgi:hypothetical protein